MKINYKNLVNFRGINLNIAPKALLLAVALMAAGQVNADTFKSISNGNWNAATTWLRTGPTTTAFDYPVAGDDVTINGGHVITVTNNTAACASLLFGEGQNQCKLIMPVNSKLTVSGLLTAEAPKNSTDNSIEINGGEIQAGNLLMSTSKNKRSVKIIMTTGMFRVLNNFTLDMPSDQSSNLPGLDINGAGTFEIGGSIVRLSTGGGALETAGVFNFSPLSTVNFNGSTVTQNVPAIPYGNLKFNGTAVKTLNGPASAVTSLLINGPVDLNFKMLNASTATVDMAQTGSVTNASSAGYLKLAAGSKMTAHNVGTAEVLFPVGTTTFTPAYITNTGNVNDFSVTLTEGFVDASITKGVVKKTWDIVQETNNGLANVTLRLEWSATDELTPFNRNWCAVGHYDNSLSQWTSTGGFGPAEGATMFSRTMSGLSSFSPFGVGDGGSPLPVELTFFHAAKKENATVLTWETASEKNNKGFEIQASADAKNFETVGSVASKNGNANFSQRYEFLDKTNRSGLVYYRLKQTDFDGTVSYYAAKVVDNGRFNHAVTAYPNPFNNQFEVKLQGDAELEVMDLTGKVVYRTNTAETGANTVTVELNNQPAGMYLLKATAAGQTTITRLVKQ